MEFYLISSFWLSKWKMFVSDEDEGSKHEGPGVINQDLIFDSSQEIEEEKTNNSIQEIH